MRRKPIPFHPLLLGLYPALTLFVQNAGMLGIVQVLGTLAAAAAFSALAWLAIAALVRQRAKAALIASVFLLLFFSHGRLLLWIVLALAQAGALRPSALHFTAHYGPYLLLLVWAGLLALVSRVSLRSRSDFALITRFANVAAVALIVLVLANWGLGRYRNAPAMRYAASWRSAPGAGTAASAGNPASPPDIYYIVLDAFGRADVLESVYGFDTQPFLDGLSAQGFYVAGSSRTNYNQTYLSLASSLNWMYLEGLAQQVGPGSSIRLPLAEMIQRSRLAHILGGQGYRVIAFATATSITEMTEADLFLRPRWSLSEYQVELINGTPLPLLLDLPFLPSLYDLHRDRILYALEHLPDTAEAASPKFVFAHIVAPHPPFVLGPNGEAVEPDRSGTFGLFQFVDGARFAIGASQQDYIQGYRDQVTFMSSTAQAVIAEILARSPRPPIIILQADHGPRSAPNWQEATAANVAEQAPILNAYYFPDQDYSALYPGITPVNTFRVILNQYFGANYRLLEDETYFSTLDRPYDWVRVPAVASP